MLSERKPFLQVGVGVFVDEQHDGAARPKAHHFGHETLVQSAPPFLGHHHAHRRHRRPVLDARRRLRPLNPTLGHVERDVEARRQRSRRETQTQLAAKLKYGVLETIKENQISD